jgi:hypothetical protein
MQQEDKILQFYSALGAVFKEMRESKANISISRFAREYDIDRGNLSKIERGMLSCRVLTAWKIAEASGLKFSEFAKRLEDKLGSNFKIFDD